MYGYRDIGLNNLIRLILSEQNVLNFGNSYLKHLSKTSVRRKAI